MELTLNIYKHGKIEKMYTAETFILTTGTCADMINLAEETKIVNLITNTDGDLLQLGVDGLSALSKVFPRIIPLLMEIFEGLTESEARQTDIVEVGQLVVNVFTYAINNLAGIKSKKK